ncbi:MAG: HlyD family efflux transporter periplasmic adaptor subunit [Bacteroidales bacterium]|nr:HlyD family efflux transporter periplasmic adaptor subunit [Bacteroidales bacterium]
MTKEQNKRKGRFSSAEKIELRSPEMQEILSRPPKSIIRYGIGLIFFFIALLCFGSYFIKYPDVIKGTVVAVSENKAEISVPIKNSGKIKQGQRVNIKFDNYPYMEFGIISTHIDRLKLTSIETENGICYKFEITLPDKLISNRNKELEYLPLMQGEADIITEDYRLSERLLSAVRKH